MLNSGLATIQDEHRSLAAVVHGLRYLLREAAAMDSVPDPALLRAIIYYLDEFPNKRHHPKEEAYLFARLRQRTDKADAAIAELERQHLDNKRQVRALEAALESAEAGRKDGVAAFAAEAENYAEDTLKHMALEENVVIPLARKYLTAEDWVEIGAAFGTNGDPRFSAAADHDYRDLFARLGNLASPGDRPGRAP